MTIGQTRTRARWVSWIFGLALLVAVVVFAVHRVFEAVSVTTLKLIGVPLAAGLAATLLFRGFSFWLPMAPGLILARRESRAG